MRRLGRLARWIALALIGAALYEQLRRPAHERTWAGRIGPVPYDFRLPTLDRVRERLWNPNDPSLLTPTVWGIGWSVNLATISQRLRPALGTLLQRVTRSASAR
ncbi:DUF5808 domain-containing protein [Thermomicrobium sp. 4228-Ro]|uniref:DUF5808 domain-containing protein n=1 Tax=Thermomicrobium sp. 4228-Ro TaxID=2993937 RepID=UPI002248960C|nr:DUF5808 domain-containing protein [Thermomicrobium sp. 4228-Ro]MCX2726865.1 DUF5808 domain-containing protein [Thermomicrobium sp. 4228-Ro]